VQAREHAGHAGSGAVWYPIVVKPGQDEIDDREIEAMLRHLWMFQLDILPTPVRDVRSVPKKK